MIRPYLYAGAALVALAVLAWFVADQRQIGADRVIIKQIENDAATQEKINNADRSMGDADTDRDWLCQRFGVDCVR